jgi:hypothetical protein
MSKTKDSIAGRVFMILSRNDSVKKLFGEEGGQNHGQQNQFLKNRRDAKDRIIIEYANAGGLHHVCAATQ